MATMITQYWSIVLTVFGGIVAVSKFYLDWLKIRELRYKLSEAESKKKRESSPIISPTEEEIRKYGVKEFIRNSTGSSVLSIVIVSFISFSIYQSNQTPYQLNKVIYEKKLFVEPEVRMLKDEIAVLQYKLKTLAELVGELELFEINALGTEKGIEFWSKASKDDFLSLFETHKNHILLGNRHFNLDEFETLDSYHYRAVYSQEVSGLVVEAKYLLVRGPQKSWFMVESVKSLTSTGKGRS